MAILFPTINPEGGNAHGKEGRTKGRFQFACVTVRMKGRMRAKHPPSFLSEADKDGADKSESRTSPITIISHNLCTDLGGRGGVIINKQSKR